MHVVDKPKGPPKPQRPKMPSLVPLLKPYKGQMLLLVLLTVAGSGVGLLAPLVMQKAVDAFVAGRLDLRRQLIELIAIAVGTFFFNNLQNVVQTIASERVARDLRTKLADKVSQQTYAQIEAQTPAKLLTNFTSDIDAIKGFIAQAAPSLVSSAFVLVAGIGILLWMKWQLALAVLPVFPLMGVAFFMLMARVRKLFGQIQGIVDLMNRVLNENIVGAALIRLVKWTRYVDQVVRTYIAPPYNVRHFQIWNEAAGRLSGGAAQATFWHGRSVGAQHAQAAPYDRAMEDYVELVHVPAARIVRKHGGYVVYGGWPDQGGLETYMRWLEYRSPGAGTRMIDWVDYLDTHYLGVDALTPLYERYVANGPARGIWQTEIGDRYMNDPHYLPMYFFKFAVWALDHGWSDPNQYVSMVYHWDGFEPYRLTHRGNPRTYNVSGRSLVVLTQVAGETLAPFDGHLAFSQGATGLALNSGPELVIQVRASPGPRRVAVGGWSGAQAGGLGVKMVDALTGEAADANAISARSNGDGLSIDFRIPEAVNGGKGQAPMQLAYLIVSPRS